MLAEPETRARDARHRIQAALRERLLPISPLGDEGHQSLVLEAGEAGTFTIATRAGRVFVNEGRAARPGAVVRTDAETLLEILTGARSGAQTWLSGHLSLRGSIALALRLEGLLDPARRPRHFAQPRRVLAGGVDTFLLEAGEGPAVVLLHGLGATNASMLTTFVELSRDHRVIAPDLPGFGDSAKPVARYDARFFAQWAVALLDALGIERAHFIGNSMGGRISLEVGLLAPARVDRLVLFAPAVAFRKLRQFVPLVRMLRPELATLPVPLPRRTVLRTLQQCFSRPDRLPAAWYEAAVDEFIRVFGTARGRVAFFSSARQIYLDPPWGAAGFWARLRELEPPALFVWGDRDVLVPSRFARHVERMVPHARSVVLRDCGHVPHFELPETTHRLVREHLRTG
ncbi:MAG: alpha/beta fold hydrolase [Polyangiaceae bacterium]|nr:alpha/beta fold hydrolase [Polyangiaceae bacterium]